MSRADSDECIYVFAGKFSNYALGAGQIVVGVIVACDLRFVFCFNYSDEVTVGEVRKLREAAEGEENCGRRVNERARQDVKEEAQKKEVNVDLLHEKLVTLENVAKKVNHQNKEKLNMVLNSFHANKPEKSSFVAHLVLKLISSKDEETMLEKEQKLRKHFGLDSRDNVWLRKQHQPGTSPPRGPYDSARQLEFWPDDPIPLPDVDGRTTVPLPCRGPFPRRHLDHRRASCTNYLAETVEKERNPVLAEDILNKTQNGFIPDLSDIPFPDPSQFVAGGIHKHSDQWEIILEHSGASDEVRNWVWNGVDIYKYIQPFEGTFWGE